MHNQQEHNIAQELEYVTKEVLITQYSQMIRIPVPKQ